MMTGSLKQKFDRAGLWALAIYAALAFALFGVPLIGHFREAYLSQGSDPSLFSWFLVWWPRAIIHRLNPFFTDSLWAPAGVNLAWTTAIPLPALIVSPITLAFGPVGAFNFLFLIGTPLSAWTAFLLCRHVSRSWWPALLGGYIFGFSAYMAGQQACGHLHLTLVLLVPLAAWIVARAISEDTEPRILMFGLAAILIAQFLISLEVFATMTVAGATALLLGWSFAPPEMAARLRKLLLPIAGAYAITALILSPYLYALFAFGSPHGAIWPVDIYSDDLFNFVLPVPSTAIGVLHLFDRMTMPFRLQGSIAEMDGYIGLPVIMIAALYAWRRFREPLGRTLLEFLIIFLVLSLGPLLHVNGLATIGLPFKAFPKIPLLDKALPGRLMLYGFLALGLIVALWLESARAGAWVKVAVAAVVVISTLPTPSSRWITQVDSPAFFATSTYRNFLKPSDNVLILPFGYRGSSMLWHAKTEMYFNMVGGWTGAAPDDFYAWPITTAFGGVRYLPDSVEQFAALLAHFSVNIVIVSQSAPDASSWDAILLPLASTRQQVGGVEVYRISAATVAPCRATTPLQMSQRRDEATIDSLVLAAGEWLSRGKDLAELTPFKAVQSGLLQDSWFVGPNTIPGWVSGGTDRAVDTTQPSFAGVLMGKTSSGDFGIGLNDSYAALQPIIAKYRATASHVYFPYPNDLLSPSASMPGPKTRALLTLVFDRQQLALAASSLRTPASRQDGLLSVQRMTRQISHATEGTHLSLPLTMDCVR